MKLQLHVQDALVFYSEHDAEHAYACASPTNHSQWEFPTVLQASQYLDIAHKHFHAALGRRAS